MLVEKYLHAEPMGYEKESGGGRREDAVVRMLTVDVVSRIMAKKNERK